MEWLAEFWRNTLTALRFFTRLPIPDWFDEDKHSAPKLNEAAVAFPVAGFLIGVIPALVWYIANQFLSPFLAASLAIFTGTLITGALHEDGLADCADGLGGGVEKERVLEIMRDSTIGTYGAVALFFSFAFRIGALASFDTMNGVIALLIAHTVASAAMVIAISTAQYARNSGLGESVREGADDSQLYTALAIGLAILIVLAFSLTAILAFVLAIFAAWIFLQYLKSRIGGYTGDGLGAMEQIAEITILITLAALWA